MKQTYIYSFWFHDDVEECKRVVVLLLSKEDFFFNYKYMHVVIYKSNNKIIGLIQIIDKDTNFDYDYIELMNMSKTYEFTIKTYIYELIKEVKKLNYHIFLI